MDRVLVVDKPAGMTSHDVVAKVKRSSGASKVGHAGTLDPGATGVLLVLVNRATRLAEFFVGCDKEYHGEIVLGVETDTQDGEGRIVAERDAGAITRAAVEAAFRLFEGDISQVPPMYSALKREGKPLYALARRGVVVEREPRSVRVERLELLDFRAPSVEFRIVCSRGTYVRTIAADVGGKLGCGAHLGRLARTRVGPFRLDNALSLEAIVEAGTEIGEIGLSLGESLPFIGRLRLDRGETDQIAFGKSIVIDRRRVEGPDTGGDLAEEPARLVRLLGPEGDLAAVARIETRPGDPPEVAACPVRVFCTPE